MGSTARHSPERDNKLNILRAILDVVGNGGDVPKVQCGNYLIHEIKRRGLVVQETQPQHSWRMNQTSP